MIPYQIIRRTFSAEVARGTNLLKVTLLGAAGTAGQTLALMLKQSPLIDELCLYDVKNISGMTLDLSLIDTKCKVTSYTGSKDLSTALKNSSIIAILASQQGVGVNHDALFETNAPIIRDLAVQISHKASKAFVAIVSQPINSLVPVCSETMKKKGRYNPALVFGVTAFPAVRANSMVAEVQGLQPECVDVPIIGGNSETTLVPLFSQTRPSSEFTNNELEELTRSVKYDEKACHRKTAFTNAFAAARFIISLVKAIKGYPNIIECAYVRSKVHPQLKYMTTPVQIGPGGIVNNLGIPKLSQYEKCQMDNMVPHLIKDIKRGEVFVGVYDPPPCDPCDPNPKAPRCPPDVCELQQMFPDKT